MLNYKILPTIQGNDAYIALACSRNESKLLLVSIRNTLENGCSFVNTTFVTSSRQKIFLYSKKGKSLFSEISFRELRAGNEIFTSNKQTIALSKYRVN